MAHDRTTQAACFLITVTKIPDRGHLREGGLFPLMVSESRVHHGLECLVAGTQAIASHILTSQESEKKKKKKNTTKSGYHLQRPPLRMYFFHLDSTSPGPTTSQDSTTRWGSRVKTPQPVCQGAFYIQTTVPHFLDTGLQAYVSIKCHSQIPESYLADGPGPAHSFLSIPASRGRG